MAAGMFPLSFTIPFHFRPPSPGVDAASARSTVINEPGIRDRSDPIGYKLSAIRFKDGAPIDASDSRTAAIDILSNRDTSQCPDHCFRPVGLAWDSQGRLYMSSDATGEIYVLVRTDGSRTEGTLPDAGSTSSSTSSSMYSSTSSSSSSALPSGSSHSGTMSVSFDSFCLLMFALIVLTSWSC